MSTQTADPVDFHPGLEGIAAARTRLSRVDGTAGRLTVAGYEIEDFADQATFEETLYLLWHDRRPDASTLAGFSADLRAARCYGPRLLRILDEAAQTDTPLIDVLRLGAAAVSLEAPSAVGAQSQALTIVATLPLIVARVAALRTGRALREPRSDLDQAANFLYMLNGTESAPRAVRALHTYWNTVADHGLNASTFAARVIISTQSDIFSAITGAIGALKGPLHGGAPGPALDTVFEIAQAERAEAVLRARLDRGERLMGFGHRIYRVRDPRADVLARAARQLYETGPERALYELAMYVEGVALRLLRERKPERLLQTNVEFYTALLLHGIGLATDLFTPIFALGRAAGWTAHCLEQLHERILRPDAIYVGALGRVWEAETPPV